MGRRRGAPSPATAHRPPLCSGGRGEPADVSQGKTIWGGGFGCRSGWSTPREQGHGRLGPCGWPRPTPAACPRPHGVAEHRTGRNTIVMVVCEDKYAAQPGCTRRWGYGDGSSAGVTCLPMHRAAPSWRVAAPTAASAAPAGDDGPTTVFLEHHTHDHAALKRGAALQHGVVLFDGMSHQLPDIDPEETAEWLDSFDAVVDSEGRTRARFLLDEAARARAGQTGGLPGHGLDPVRQHHSPRPRAMVPRRRVSRATHPRLHPVERGRDGHPGQPPKRRHRRPSRHLRQLGLPLRGGVQPLLQGQGRRRGRRPRLLPGPCLPGHLRAGIRRGASLGGPARQLPPRGGRARPAELSPPPPAARTSGSTPRCPWGSDRCAPSTRRT